MSVPTYSYACTSCEHRFDVQQSFSDTALTQCPECTGRLRKVFSAVGVVFKGSGFYRTDSRPAGGESKTPAPDSGGSAGKAGSDGASGGASGGSGSTGASTGGSSGGASGGSSGSSTTASAPAA